MLTIYAAVMASIAYSVLRLADQSIGFSLSMACTLLISIPSLVL